MSGSHRHGSTSDESVPCCSTLESVVVGFTASSFATKSAAPSAQRSKASLSGSHRDNWRSLAAIRLLNARKRRCRVHDRYCNVQLRVRVLLNARKRRCRVHGIDLEKLDHPKICSTLESVVVGFTIGVAFLEYHDWRLLNARKRRCRVHSRRHPARRPRTGLLNARKRRCRVHAPGRRRGPGFRGLLNARKRRCRVHVATPSRSSATPTILLNARKRRCRVHGRFRRLATRGRRPAQRSKASLSGSPERRRFSPASGYTCSTLESVVVGFTQLTSKRLDGLKALLNARKRRCRVHQAGLAASLRENKAAQRSKASLSGSLSK